MEKGYIEQNDRIIIQKGDTIHGDFSVVGKDLEVFGFVGGDVAVVGGDLTVEGFIAGDVAVVGGDCVLLKGSFISGDLAVVGGKIKRSKRAKIGGEATVVNLGPLTSPLRLLKFLAKGVHVEEKKGEESIERDTTQIDTTKIEKEEIEEEEVEKERKNVFLTIFEYFILPVLPLIILGFFIFLVNFIFPGCVENMERELILNPWQILGTGFLVQIIYFPVLLILVISVLGIPLALAIFLATPLLLIYGSAPVLNLMGKFIFERFNFEYKSKNIPLIFSLIFFALLFLITSGLVKVQHINLFFSLLFFFFFSLTFLSVYVVLTFATGVVIFAKLGIKKSE